MLRTVSLLAVAIVALVSPVTAADPPGLAVASTEPMAAQPVGSVKVSAGRFIPLAITSGKPSLLLGNESGLLELYPVKQGESVFGVRYDEPPGAKVKRYTFPAGATHIAVAGDVGGVVTLTAVVNGKTANDAPTVAGTMVVELTGPRPPPIVDPIVDPVVPPKPVGKLFGMVLIEETNTPFANRGLVLNAAIAWAKANGVNHRFADKDVKDATGQPPADLVPYLNRAAGKPWPQLFLVTAEGKLLYDGPSPTDPAAIVALLEKHKGK